MPQIGDFAPDFTLPCITAEGTEQTLTLSALRPLWVVLFFYPRDATPTCTREAQDFSGLAPAFEALGARVIGISKDSIAAHRRFAGKQALRLTLASDAGTEVCESYRAWGAKTLYGRAYTGILRTTVLIDSTGRVAADWRGVKVAGHAEAVLAAVQRAEK